MKRSNKSAGVSGAGAGAHVIASHDRVAIGKALRTNVARELHGRWRSFKSRPNPIDILRNSDAGRMEALVPIRYGRMLQSPFAFYRGSAGLMASDLAHTPNTGLHVQACGDCHLMNFGGFATPERNIIFDINDFDETLPAPWEWDVKRLVASIVLAARSIGLSDNEGRECAESAARSYRERMHDYSGMDPLRVWYSNIGAEDVIGMSPRSTQKAIRRRIDKAAARNGSEMDFPKLAETVGGQARILDQPPLIFHPDVSRGAEAKGLIEKLFQDYRTTLADDRCRLLDRYQLVDVAIKVVGVGSVGRRCWIGLLMSEEGSPLFLQFKEAAQSVLEPYVDKSVYAHHGQRVVMGQRLMQPASDIFLGWMTGLEGRHFYVRQLRDAKIKPLIETFSADVLDIYAIACGWVLARAHTKVSELSATISGYLGATSDEFDVAMGNFALAYADQAEHDYTALKTAVRQGKISVFQETA